MPVSPNVWTTLSNSFTFSYELGSTNTVAVQTGIALPQLTPAIVTDPQTIRAIVSNRLNSVNLPPIDSFLVNTHPAFKIIDDILQRFERSAPPMLVTLVGYRPIIDQESYDNESEEIKIINILGLPPEEQVQKILRSAYDLMQEGYEVGISNRFIDEGGETLWIYFMDLLNRSYDFHESDRFCTDIFTGNSFHRIQSTGSFSRDEFELNLFETLQKMNQLKIKPDCAWIGHSLMRHFSVLRFTGLFKPQPDIVWSRR